MKIDNVTITLTVDGCPCIVAMDQDRLKMLLDIASSLSENGKLNVAKLNPEKFQKIQLAKDDYMSDPKGASDETQD